MQSAVALLEAWSNYYIIMGSSAAALTGLMFVVVTLAADGAMPAEDVSRGYGTFSSPTVVHFCAAFLIAGVMSAPWQSLWIAATTIAVCGVFGMIYSVRIARQAGMLTSYEPVLEDWIWYAILPFVTYVAVALAGAFVFTYPRLALFGLAAATMLLIFIGIHNAWDVVTWLAIEKHRKKNES